MINYESNTRGYLDITFGPVWDYVPLTRNYIESFLMVHMVEKKDIIKVVTAASELLENAVKHSNSDGIRVRITKSQDTDKIELVVYNTTTEDDYNFLKGIVEKANSASNTLEYYVTEMKESYARHDGKAMLGIPRIRHESGVKLDLNFTENKNELGVKLDLNFTENKNELGVIEVKAVFNAA